MTQDQDQALFDGAKHIIDEITDQTLPVDIQGIIISIAEKTDDGFLLDTIRGHLAEHLKKTHHTSKIETKKLWKETVELLQEKPPETQCLDEVTYELMGCEIRLTLKDFEFSCPGTSDDELAGEIEKCIERDTGGLLWAEGNAFVYVEAEGIWKPLAKGELWKIVAACSNVKMQYYDAREGCVRVAPLRMNTRKIDAVAAYIERKNKSLEPFPTPPHAVIAFKNCCAVIRDGEVVMAPHDRENYRRAACNLEWDGEPFDWDDAPEMKSFFHSATKKKPALTEHGIEVEIDYAQAANDQEKYEWAEELEEAKLLAQDVDDRLDVICETFGAIGLGDTRRCVTTDERIIVLYGPTKSGKSQTAKLTEKVAGTDGCCTVSPKDLDQRFRITDLAGAVLNVVDEAGNNCTVWPSLWKKVHSPGALLTGERKGQDTFKFHATHQTIMTANEGELQKFQRADDAIDERHIIVDFAQFEGERRPMAEIIFEKESKQAIGQIYGPRNAAPVRTERVHAIR